ncbi:MAG: UDP-N-acetylglucosamine--dolichyl-phosphate N-acetylglucosaminephosphotransferase [Candidatus Odinarchaeum yellowstonii]|uniref:UDP-N-acetylglucosamine--dolichyl-phosphate N-acetylglucosaminephosphotransferase n=1 Tax=Odinarchaeota yellowstonii (strain LCB_4) TaxID=1841599 RepID=A0AAF0ID23_ODILC|nr:MAG: UDP-N-acetylglucosamine--dolichyl-phosphate N-acetylglucosaminephosphotransferase [Candidatus Odinarchaeum yellowstonii]
MVFSSFWWVHLIIFAAAFLFSFISIPLAARKFKSAGLTGVNLHSKSREELPESLGVIIGMITIIIIILSSFLLESLIDLIYTIIMSAAIALILGFADDILSIRWRYKILIPLVASIPLILNYTGSTLVEIPFIGVINLGIIYTLILIPLITVYMSNSINIYAGLNLLEVGQVIVLTGVIIFIGVVTGNELALHMSIPFLAGSIALAWFNKYPARVFVGNSFTYFSGMFLISIAILTNMEKLFILCTFPQLINFLYSLRDFTGKTARHRVPKYNVYTGLLEDSGNHTLLNLVIKLSGPMSEKKLSNILILIQLVNAIIVLAGWFLLRVI